MAFPVGTYNVTLGRNEHANWQGTLNVYAVQTPSGTAYAATYLHGNSPAHAVQFSYGTNASGQNWIAFTDGNVNFGQAAQGSSNGPFNGNVTGLPSLAADPNDTWTATVSTVNVPKPKAKAKRSGGAR